VAITVTFPFKPVVLDRHILAFDVAGVVETFAEGSCQARGGIGRPVPDKTDHRQRRLLRACRERPRNDSTAEKRDELAAFHGRPLQQATTPYHVAELSAVFCITAKLAADVREGSDSDIATWLPDVRFTPKSGHRATNAACPLCAKERHGLDHGWRLSQPSPAGFVVKNGSNIFSLTSAGIPVPLSRIRISTLSPRFLVAAVRVGLVVASLRLRFALRRRVKAV
jgi:hypothetical protein